MGKAQFTVSYTLLDGWLHLPFETEIMAVTQGGGHDSAGGPLIGACKVLMESECQPLKNSTPPN
jgi:hypothetical protein